MVCNERYSSCRNSRFRRVGIRRIRGKGRYGRVVHVRRSRRRRNDARRWYEHREQGESRHARRDGVWAGRYEQGLFVREDAVRHKWRSRVASGPGSCRRDVGLRRRQGIAFLAHPWRRQRCDTGNSERPGVASVVVYCRNVRPRRS